MGELYTDDTNNDDTDDDDDDDDTCRTNHDCIGSLPNEPKTTCVPVQPSKGLRTLKF